MPPKTSSSTTAKANKINKEASEAITTYVAQKPDFEKLVKEARENPNRPLTGSRQTEYSRKVKEAVKEVLEERRALAEQGSKTTEMPHHPKDNTSESSKDMIIAREAVIANRSDLKDSTEKVSQETEPSNTKDKATVHHHKANPGPVMADNLGPKAGKEELRKRAEELNKK
jgi:hypothetical protein